MSKFRIAPLGTTHEVRWLEQETTDCFTGQRVNGVID
jgi:hypothetical protein